MTLSNLDALEKEIKHGKIDLKDISSMLESKLTLDSLMMKTCILFLLQQLKKYRSIG